MLHDPSHIQPVPVEEEIILSGSDKDVLRRLGAEYAEYGAADAGGGKAELWRDLNDLKAKRPMVWINEIPWHEMDVDGELVPACSHPWARELETTLRKTVYQRKHMPADMIVSPYIECPKVFHSTDFGIVEKTTDAITDADSDIYSRHFEIQIREPEDIEKIQRPRITYMEKATEYRYAAMRDIFDGIAEVRLVGQSHIWYTPWDYLVRWWGIQEALMDLVMRADMVHAAYERMVDAWMAELDQFDELNLLSLDANNTRIGSGGYGYVSELPKDDADMDHIRPHDMWGCSNAQIFSTVSPEMHWEFAVEHDLRWLERFGLTYYGCCEPLDKKIDILRRIPNLRKISVSPWCDTASAVEGIGDSYVMSRKPNPAIFVTDPFDEAEAERQLREFLDAAKGCHVELIMKDISTVGYRPENLWKWERIAMNLAEEYAA
ncbi:MAG: hypothetical protein LBG82_00470 [Clostridiales Family XIII bacterium]|jgi:hypothetical protein|nr:hypothetical protein [Clostridiales Family XIII bacterium]